MMFMNQVEYTVNMLWQLRSTKEMDDVLLPRFGNMMYVGIAGMLVYGALSAFLWQKTDYVAGLLTRPAEDDGQIVGSGTVGALILFAAGAMVFAGAIPECVRSVTQYLHREAATGDATLYYMIGQLLQLCVGAGLAYMSVHSLKRGQSEVDPTLHA